MAAKSNRKVDFSLLELIPAGASRAALGPPDLPVIRLQAALGLRPRRALSSAEATHRVSAEPRPTRGHQHYSTFDRTGLSGFDRTTTEIFDRASWPGVTGQYPQPVSAKAQTRNPKSEMPECGFGLRYSAFFRVSALGFRIWGAGGGWYCPPFLTDVLASATLRGHCVAAASPHIS